MPASFKNLKEALTLNSLIIYFLNILTNLILIKYNSLACKKTECKILLEKDPL